MLSKNYGRLQNNKAQALTNKNKHGPHAVLKYAAWNES